MQVQIEYTYTLEEFVKTHGTESAARHMGVTRAAVRQMQTTGRHILVKKVGKRWCYAEIKPYKHARSLARTRAINVITPPTPANTEEPAHANAA